MNNPTTPSINPPKLNVRIQHNGIEGWMAYGQIGATFGGHLEAYGASRAEAFENLVIEAKRARR